MPAPTYQDVVRANGAVASWALVEAAGTDFAPWIGGTHLALSGVADYQQAGPFAAALALRLHIAARLTYPFAARLIPPVTTEVWARLSALAPPTSQILFYAGNQAANGSGLYIANSNHVFFYAGGVYNTDSGYVWPDTNWHLVQLAQPTSSSSTLYIDGIGVQNGPAGTPTAPVPNGQGWGSDDNTYGATELVTLAYPTLYQHALTAPQAYASFLAASDPTTALSYVLSPIGGTYQSDLLTQVLASVRKTY